MKSIDAPLRRLMLLTAGMLLIAGLAMAEPRIQVDYHAGIPQVKLEGTWTGSYYTIHRANSANGPFRSLSSLEVLCTGECFIDDFDAQPGNTYWYRFDLALATGESVSFGPYAVAISAELARRVSAAVYPNPGSGRTQIELLLAGAPSAARLDAVAELFDVQGRALRTLHRGPMARGVTRLNWDGRDRDGRTLGAGIYYLRFATPLGSTTTRVVRAR